MTLFQNFWWGWFLICNEITVNRILSDFLNRGKCHVRNTGRSENTKMDLRETGVTRRIRLNWLRIRIDPCAQGVGTVGLFRSRQFD
jgi:hypothetical protein